MLKSLVFFTLLTFPFCGTIKAEIGLSHDICLMQENSDFRNNLNGYISKTYLEFGSGLWTEFFLETCKRVISVDFVTPGYGPDSIKNNLKTFSYHSNWIPFVYFSGYTGDTNWAPYKYLGSEHVHKAASYQCATHQNYAYYDDFYLIELSAFIDRLLKTNTIEAIFVNSGLYIRGDLVQLMFGKIPIIFAGDTDCRKEGISNDVYGYSRVVTPEEYEEIYIPNSSGITVWILKTDKYQPLISTLTVNE